MARNSYKKQTINGSEYYYKQIELGWSVNGKRKRKVLRAKTVKELETKIKDFEKLRQIGNASDVNQNFSNFLYNWLYNVQFPFSVENGGYKPSTKERYDGIFKNYLQNSSLGKIKVSEINALKVNSFYNDLIQSGVSAPTVVAINKLVKPCLVYAHLNGNTVINFGARGLIKIPTSKSIKEEIEILTREEQNRFIESLEGNSDRVIYILALSTGMRLGEVLGLKWADIDFNNQILSVNRNIKRVKYVETSKSEIIEQIPKTKNSIRTIPLTNELTLELKKHQTQQKHLKLLLGDKYINKDLVFTVPNGNYIEDSNLRKRFKKALAKADIKEIKFHALRHTFATRLFENDVAIGKVSRLLGHSDIVTTMNVYSHLINEHMDDLRNTMNNIL